VNNDDDPQKRDAERFEILDEAPAAAGRIGTFDDPDA
jgi:hypothetical protein